MLLIREHKALASTIALLAFMVPALAQRPAATDSPDRTRVEAGASERVLPDVVVLMHDVEENQRKAEAELAEREKRVRKLDIRGLTRDEQTRFANNWKKTQGHFVDAPSPAVSEADSLVKELMLARRYPVGEFEQRAADISVDHPDVVNNYRNAHEIAERNKSGKATTEDLRQAMVHYRSLFEELLETTAAESSNQSERTKADKEVAK